MTLIQRLVRPAIAKLHPYKSARSMVTEAKVFLDANEAAEAPDTFRGVEWARELNRYPLPQPPEMVDRFAELYGVRSDQVFIGRGSDEAIDVLTRTFCDADKDGVMMTPPTYGMYEVAANIQGAQVISVNLVISENGFALDLPAIKRALQSPGVTLKMIYLCSPNNPTGAGFSAGEIRSVLEASRDQALVVVDEAYREFSPEQTCLSLLREFPNLVVLRTLSKAWALAGLRCGVALGDPELISLLQKVRAPYPLPRPVIELALRALSEQGRAEMKNRVACVVSERGRVAKALADLPCVEKVYPSEANFLLVKFRDQKNAMEAARAAGVIIRSRDTEVGLKNCVRLTIGTRDENQILLRALAGVGL